MPRICSEYQCLSWYSYTIPVLAPLIAVRAGGTANTRLASDNGYIEDPVGFVTFGSRRFNISLEISIAEILIMIDFVSQSSLRIKWRLTRWSRY